MAAGLCHPVVWPSGFVFYETPPRSSMMCAPAPAPAPSPLSILLLTFPLVSLERFMCSVFAAPCDKKAGGAPYINFVHDPPVFFFLFSYVRTYSLPFLSPLSQMPPRSFF